MARLASYVHVHKDGASHVFGPEDEVPEWAAALITNPLAWAEPPYAKVDLRDEPVTPPVKRASPRRKATADGAVHGG
jgi:hypothetical protein